MNKENITNSSQTLTNVKVKGDKKYAKIVIAENAKIVDGKISAKATLEGEGQTEQSVDLIVEYKEEFFSDKVKVNKVANDEVTEEVKFAAHGSWIKGWNWGFWGILAVVALAIGAVVYYFMTSSSDEEKEEEVL